MFDLYTNDLQFQHWRWRDPWSHSWWQADLTNANFGKVTQSRIYIWTECISSWNDCLKLVGDVHDTNFICDIKSEYIFAVWNGESMTTTAWEDLDRRQKVAAVMEPRDKPSDKIIFIKSLLLLSWSSHACCYHDQHIVLINKKSAIINKLNLIATLFPPQKFLLWRTDFKLNHDQLTMLLDF